MENDVGSTVRKLQSNVDGIQDETETLRHAADELQQRRRQRQDSLDAEDRRIAERRSSLAQLKFRIKSQTMEVDDWEARVKEAEHESAAVQADLSRLQRDITDEKIRRLEQLDSFEGHVQALARQFQQAASLVDERDEVARDNAEAGGTAGRAVGGQPPSDRAGGHADNQADTDAARARVSQLRTVVSQLTAEIEQHKQRETIPQRVKRRTLTEAAKTAGALVQHLQALHCDSDW